MLQKLYYIHTMKNVSIKKCLIEHIDKIFEIDKNSSCYNWTKQMFMAELNNKNSFFKILTFKDNIVGYIIYNSVLDEAEILNIVIDKNFQRQKFGSYLLEETINELAKINIKTIYLEVGQNNNFAINLYLKYGFINYNKRINYYKNKETAILMKKIIDKNINIKI